MRLKAKRSHDFPYSGRPSHTGVYSTLTGPAPPQSWREIWAITVSDSRD